MGPASENLHRNGPGDPNAPILFTDPKLTLAMPRKNHSAVSAQDRLVRPSVRLLQTKVARQPEGRGGDRVAWSRRHDRRAADGSGADRQGARARRGLAIGSFHG